MDRSFLVRFAWLSICAALVTIGLKSVAYCLTGSVGLLSDALESGVNLVAAVIALVALAVAARPPDGRYNFGYGNAELFAGAAEGILILIASLGITYTSIQRLLSLQPLEQIGSGLLVSAAASLINLVVARVLLGVGKKYNSIALMADSQHLMTDVWTSVGVIAGVAAVGATGWLWIDPVIALLVAANIAWMGVQLLKRSTMGLLDSVIPREDLNRLQEALDAYSDEGVRWHSLRTRQAGHRAYASVHIEMPGQWTVAAGHNVLDQIEAKVQQRLPHISLTTHLEASSVATGGQPTPTSTAAKTESG